MYLGIEIGGTKLQLGLGADTGTLAALCRRTVEVAAGPEGIRQQIVNALPELLGCAGVGLDEVKAVGVGFGGPVDDATQTVIKSHQIPGWDHFDLPAWVSRMVDRPAVLGNDADVAGLAEALHGAGKGYSPVFYVTIGSGIGGGLVVDGEIYRGCGRGAAEVGHLRIAVGNEGGGPQHFVLEQVASGWAIQERARAEMLRPDYTGTMLRAVDGRAEDLTTAHVAAAARAGDRVAWAILDRAWDSLAEALCHVIALLCPRRIVIGGGVALMEERLLFEPLRRLVAERVFRPFAGCYEIVPAALGEEVVVHGAIALARRRFPN